MTPPAPDSLAPLDLLARAGFVTADAAPGEAIALRTTVVLDRPPARVTSARIVATAHGVYELFLDRAPVSPDLLSPGWTSYEWRLAYQTWDVTDAVRAARPAGEPDGAAHLHLAARLGNGWFRGDLGFAEAKANYGSEIGLIAALEIVYDDGTTQLVTTGTDWMASTCDVVENTFYRGQRIDARLRRAPARSLVPREAPFDRSRLVAQIAEPVRRHETFSPRRVWRSPSGAVLIDFGQNLVGWLRLRVQGPAGREITVRHAEVLEHEELGTRPLRTAGATDTFVLSGDGVDEFEPTFTFHGFRYAEITGWPGDLVREDEDGTLDPEAISAVVIHNAMRPTSTFECSNELVNQLVHNSVWGQKGNFLAVPTDCPQRDERLGWTGDIAAYAATASFQYDTADFLHSWLEDVALETAANGFVPVVVPDVLRHGTLDRNAWEIWTQPQAVWADAACWVPQALWHAYGDRERLSAHYPLMVAHLESVEPRLSEAGTWLSDYQLGDWLDPDAPPDQPADAKADSGVVATAALFRSATFTALAARELGEIDDGVRWDALAARLRSGFREAYVTDGPQGLRVTSDCATVYALAIRFGLLDDVECARAADRLAELVAARDYRVTTGFAGTPFVTWALSEHGHVAEAYRLLLETGCPSWLYPVTMGATTIWERWDSMLPDGTINPGEMTSFNHYALGAVADWIYQVVGGIRPAEPGYRRILVRPVPGPGIDWASTGYDSRVGRIETAWRLEDGTFHLEVSIPGDVPADIVLPDGTTLTVAGGRHTLECRLV